MFISLFTDICRKNSGIQWRRRRWVWWRRGKQILYIASQQQRLYNSSCMCIYSLLFGFLLSSLFDIFNKNSHYQTGRNRRILFFYWSLKKLFYRRERKLFKQNLIVLYFSTLTLNRHDSPKATVQKDLASRLLVALIVQKVQWEFMWKPFMHTAKQLKRAHWKKVMA